MQKEHTITCPEKKAPPGKFRVLSIPTQNYLEDVILVKDCDTLPEAFTACTTHNSGDDLTSTYFCFDDEGNQPGNHSSIA